MVPPPRRRRKKRPGQGTSPGPSNSAPAPLQRTPTTRVASSRGKGQSRAKSSTYQCPKDAQEIIDAGMIRIPTKDKSMFYANVGSTQVARDFARDRQLIILADVLDQKYLRWCVTNCVPHTEFWTYASVAFARVSLGDVWVWLNEPSPGPGGVYNFHKKEGGPQKGEFTIWEQYEWPELQLNTQVTRVRRLRDGQLLNDAESLFNRVDRSSGSATQDGSGSGSNPDAIEPVTTIRRGRSKKKKKKKPKRPI